METKQFSEVTSVIQLVTLECSTIHTFPIGLAARGGGGHAEGGRGLLLEPVGQDVC